MVTGVRPADSRGIGASLPGGCENISAALSFGGVSSHCVASHGLEVKSLRRIRKLEISRSSQIVIENLKTLSTISE